MNKAKFALLKETAVVFFVLIAYFCEAQNLILNGDCELPLSNGEIPFWVEASGNNWSQRTASPDPQSGANYFFGGTSAISELSQLIDISAYACRIDTGAQTFQFTGYTRSFDQNPRDESLFIIEFLNNEGANLLSTTFGPFSVTASWFQTQELLTAPAGARKLNIRLRSLRNGGSNNDGYFDNLSLIPQQTEPCNPPVSAFYSADSSSCSTAFQTNFSDSSTNSPTSWKWYFDGASPDSSTDQNPIGISYTEAGSYSVTLIACNDFGCDTTAIDDLIHIFPAPPAPEIINQSDTLFASGSGNFSWFENSQPQTSLSSDSFLVPTQAGSYFVLLTDQNGCEAQSQPYTYLPSQMQDIPIDRVVIYPNPAGSFVTIFNQSGKVNGGKISIFNSPGQLIQYRAFSTSPMVIDLSGLSPGVYFIQCLNGNKFPEMLKVIKD